MIADAVWERAGSSCFLIAVCRGRGSHPLYHPLYRGMWQEPHLCPLTKAHATRASNAIKPRDLTAGLVFAFHGSLYSQGGPAHISYAHGDGQCAWKLKNLKYTLERCASTSPHPNFEIFRVRRGVSPFRTHIFIWSCVLALQSAFGQLLRTLRCRALRQRAFLQGLSAVIRMKIAVGKNAQTRPHASLLFARSLPRRK